MPEEDLEAPELGIGPLIESPEEEASATLGTQDVADSTVPSTLGPDSANGSAYEPFDMASVDFRRVDLATIPEGADRDLAAHIQQQIRSGQGDASDQAQSLANDRALLNEERAQILELQKTLINKEPMTAQEADTAANRLDTALNDPSLNANQKKGLTFMQEVVNDLKEEMRAEFGGGSEAFDELKSKVDGFETTAVNEGQKEFLSQADTARKAYGDDIDNHATFVRLNLGIDNENNRIYGVNPQINPATGTPHTVQSLYELVTGRTQTLADNLRAEDSQVRVTQRNLAAGTQPQAPKIAPNDKPSEAEVLQEVRALGFGSAAS